MVIHRPFFFSIISTIGINRGKINGKHLQKLAKVTIFVVFSLFLSYNYIKFNYKDLV